jgi:hypothetical protein
MNNRTKSKPTQKQIDVLLKKYSKKENVLDLLYTGPVNTPIRLQEALKYGISLNSFAYGTQNYLTLPEYKTGVIPSGTVTAWKNHMDIVKTILLNFINTNPDYFRKVSKIKYAVNEIFILDVLFHNKDKGFDITDLSSIFNYIINFDNFSTIVETFYLPYHKEETPYTLRRRFREVKPYKYKKQVSSPSLM